MGQPFPTQHPAVVLRSHFKLVSWLLAVAMAAVVALSVAVVIVANDGDEITAAGGSAGAAALPNAAVHAHPLERAAQADGVRYDGGPDEGTLAIIAVPQAPDARYDGGPNEGTAAISQPTPAPTPERVTDSTGSENSAPTQVPMGPGGR